ncbi:MAG: hypothetical protein Q7U04_01135 [Bacteriovorax sp.]|nr:hypothetical protein [Bacteriovorax sp.]
MRLLVSIFFLLSTSAFAASNTYDLKMNLMLNGKHVSSPRIIVRAGERATITQKQGDEESYIDVIATESTSQNKGIMMNFTIGKIDKDGTKTIIASPGILAKENAESNITINQDTSVNPELSLTVIAKRKKL